MPRRSLGLYVHALGHSSEFERVDRTLDRLKSLSAAGTIDDYRVTVWGEGLVLDSRGRDTAPGRQMVHQLLLCHHWCLVNRADTDRVFTTDGRAPSEMTISVAPVVLCEYVGSRLAFVSPYEDDRRSVTVADHLRTLERGSDDRLVARTDATRIEDPARSGRDHTVQRTRQTAKNKAEQ